MKSQDEVLKEIKETGTDAQNILFDTDPKLMERFYASDKIMTKLLSDVKKQFPDATYFNVNGGLNLLLGEPQSNSGQSQLNLIACCGKSQSQVINNAKSQSQVLKIIKCTDPLRWYSDKVGEIVPFLKDTGDEYESREPLGYINYVQYEDAEIINI